MNPHEHRRAFALVLTLALVALLTLAVIGIGLTNRLGHELDRTGLTTLLARRHARLALDAAMAGLQRDAGDDAAVTGMAGVTGVAAGAGNASRHWCGVWSDTGAWRGWMASSTDGTTIPNLGGADSIEILGDASLGADGTDKEHVRVVLQPVVVETESGSVRLGSCAWWVGDEGVKLSAHINSAGVPVSGATHAVDELIVALDPHAAALGRVEAYGQLAFAATPTLTPGPLQANLHALTVEHRGVDAAGSLRSGLLNVNTTNVRFWRGLAATYNRLKPATSAALVPAAFASVLRDELPAADLLHRKATGGPFLAVEDFLASTALSDAIGAAGGNRDDFAAALRPWLAVRSTTFRVRAYGDARDPFDPTQVEAVAWCKAIVDRSSAVLPGFGRRYAIRSFRWLGPDDL